MAAKLILSLDGNVVREYPLDKERLSVGRKQHNDIVIDNMAVSGEHAVFVTRSNETLLEDMDSTNGVMVNDEPVNKRLLHNNDVIRISRFSLKYVNEQPAPAAAEEEETFPDARIPVASGTSPGKPQTMMIAGIIVAAAAVAIAAWLALDKTPAATPTPVAQVAMPASPPPPVASPPVATQPAPAAAPSPEPVAVPKPDARRQTEAKPRPKAERARKEDVARKAPDEPAQQPHAQTGGETARQDGEQTPKKATPPAAKAAPPQPHSPAELCADRSNFISRSLCELRTCQEPQWSRHPFCVKLHEQQNRRRQEILQR